MSPTLAPLCPDRPYPGIEAFNYADHPVFFAREEEAEKLLRSVIIYRSVLVFGRSGTGKSSLINAGFVPRALSEGLAPDRIRLQPRPGQEIIIERIARYAECKPLYLASSFASEENAVSRQVLSITEFRARIAAQQFGKSIPVLIFDQFEEFVSLFEEAPRGDSLLLARRVQSDLLDVLVSLHRDADLRVKLLFVFREDYLAKLGKLFNRCPDLRDTFLHLTAPRTAALEQIILGPFRRFPGRFPREFPEALARRLQFALEERCHSSELNLSEVQIVCQRLWLNIDQEREFAAKGLQGLLEDYLAESLGRLPADLRDPAVALLSRMVTAEGLRNVISEEDLIARVLHEERLRRDKVERALASLVADTRLVRRERREDVVFFEIVSEFLAPWIRRQKAMRRVRALRRRWVAATTVLLFIALASVGATIWVLRERTESAIARDEVRRARLAENMARFEAQAAQRARVQDEGKLAVALSDRKAALLALEESRKTLSQVRPQLALQARLEEMTKQGQQLRADNARLTQSVATLRQELEASRKHSVTRSPLASLPLSPPVLTGTLRPGELTVFTAAPFDSGIACFIMETDPASSIRSGMALVAVANSRETWQKNMRKASELLRDAAGRIFRDLGAKDSESRNTAVDSMPKLVQSQLSRTLPGLSGVYTSVTSQPSPQKGNAETYRILFEFKDASYELRLEAHRPRDFQVSVFRVTSNPR